MVFDAKIIKENSKFIDVEVLRRMPMALSKFPYRAFCLLLPVIILPVSSCRPSAPGRSKLWSVRTADDFERLVQHGRIVGGLTVADEQMRLSGTTGVLGGLRVSSIEMDEANEAIVRVIFDSRGTPAVRAESLRSFTMELISRIQADLRVDSSELKPVSFVAGRGSQTVLAFTREISGIPVRDSLLAFVFGQMKDGYHLMEIENRTWGHIEPESRQSGAKLTDQKIAQVTRRKNTRIIASRDGYRIENKASHPRLLPTTWYDVLTEDGQKFTLTFSGGEEPQLIEAYPHRYSSLLEATAFSRNWNGPKDTYPLPDVTIESSSGRLSTNNLGRLPPNFQGGRVNLRSFWAKLISESGSTTNFEIANENGRTVLKQGNQGVTSGVNAYVAISRVRAFVSKFLTAQELPYLKKSVKVTTDIADKCNAYYQGLTLSFFAKGGKCANMALVNDVVYHEWGHGLDDYSGPGSENYGGGMTDGAFSEGIGDIVAMMMTHDSNMGVGFYTDDATKPIRNLENKKVYIPGQSSEIHSQGTIIGGAFWELRKRMINKYGDAGHEKAASLFFRHLKEADSYLSSYKIVQRLADDDNNTVTRHPDWCLINHAFAVKGLTKEDPCDDDFATGTSGNETKIFGSLGESASADATPLTISASFDQAQSVKLCEGRDPCANPMVLQPQGQAGVVKLFGPTNIKAADGAYFNADVIDATGNSVGRRIMKVTKK
jgi:hypothetical protein